MVPETHYHHYSYWFADDEYYGGCCWYVDIEDIEEFKANWIYTLKDVYNEIIKN